MQEARWVSRVNERGSGPAGLADKIHPWTQHTYCLTSRLRVWAGPVLSILPACLDVLSLSPCTAVCMPGRDFGTTVISPSCLASLRSHSRSTGEEPCSPEETPAFRVHTDKSTHRPRLPTSFQPLRTIRINTFSNGASPIISLPLKTVTGLCLSPWNVHHAFILSAQC